MSGCPSRTMLDLFMKGNRLLVCRTVIPAAFREKEVFLLRLGFCRIIICYLQETLKIYCVFLIDSFSEMSHTRFLDSPSIHGY